MNKIKLMSPQLANLIAAGEVIERPSSVVKELVENSLDAGASNIVIRVEEAGKKLISVDDNGCGMSKEDAQLAFKRHASSKVKTVYDLNYISTLGFRGEAVPSIASVSHFEMITSDGMEGTKIISDPDKDLIVESSSLKRGTICKISELFFNTPARLKYLKSERTENLSIIETCQHLSLGFPNVSMSLYIDNRLIFQTSGRGDLLEAISLIYGPSLAKACLYIESKKEDFDYSGYIAHPQQFSRSTRYDILTFLNNRYVYSPKLQKAIIDAYKDYLPPMRYPIAIVKINVDNALVDVNVHPSKKEVRLSCEDNLSQDLNRQVAFGLLKTRHEFSNVDIPQVETRRIETPALNSEVTFSDSKQTEEVISESNPTLFDEFNKEEIMDMNIAVQPNSIVNEKEEIKTRNIDIPIMHPIGQVLGTYIVCDSDQGMYIVDQHAAHERINFEKCERDFCESNDRVIPLFPLVFDLTPHRKSNLDKEHIEVLANLGIIVSDFGNASVKVEEIPRHLSSPSDRSTIEEIIADVLEDNKVDLVKIKRLAIASKACKMSIKANKVMNIQEQVLLLKELFSCKNPLNCPHGRPTVIKISQAELEKLFKRSGF